MWQFIVDLFTTDTVTIQYGMVSDAMWDSLRSLGYTGIPGDGSESLYVPQDVAIDNCYTDTDCAIASN